MTLSDFTPQVESHFKNNLPFVLYNEPNNLQVHALLQQSDKQHLVKNLTRTGFVFMPYSNKNRAILIPDEHADAISAELDAEYFQSLAPRVAATDVPIVAVNYEQMLGDAIDQINKGNLLKVVCSRKEVVSGSFDPIALFMATLKHYHDAFVYSFFHPKVGFWIGATPETFIKVDGTTFKTMALAGTQKVFPDINPQWTPKEVNEQSFVTKAITESLESLAKVIVVSKTYNKQAGALWHICNDISGTLKNKKEMLHRVLEALHPTPAVCGLPRTKAKNFISKHENYDREYYTGYLGRVTSGLNTQLYVNLRCMKITDQAAEIFVGGGVTEGSNIFDEWVETVNKAETMKQILRLPVPS
ncbi:isochorismate synthase [Gilvibacter sp.]|uniref:isochorismate synthase n=1 Tax=Gilvibacter sp. TaxID=2729997 RepID=UPI003F49E1E9